MRNTQHRGLYNRAFFCYFATVLLVVSDFGKLNSKFTLWQTNIKRQTK
jgi:hypothetical protein